ncbi:hypothetical protein PSA7680_02162 [Pseudoruegeria aquimaris]|uniref:DUF1800 domain-containing protein n=1 Tax=Pseudoruegeria aquimaris TaxID=393663 RepID=A0A1Y5SMU8_9RHOB|nr:DUF1800 domain-containing protein [Pseudoruegeria aquimaris]SLN43227.1 hypothetical protein PSA7680_02162 [Pseudoruegeria aquimaris]
MFDPETAAIRFGTGLSPQIAPPQSVTAMLDGLKGPDAMAARIPIAPFSERLDSFPAYNELSKARTVARKAGDSAAERAARDAQRKYRRALGVERLQDMNAALARAAETPDGLRERLVWFWADHFTAIGRNPPAETALSGYVEEAIRPHVTGNFAQLLRAVELHPIMLTYLDQHVSVGPNSRAAQKAKRGLNENLARELLELHTVGVDGSYTQSDVRELARLLTGAGFSPRQGGFRYRENIAEPGEKRVLGASYGSEAPNETEMLRFLDDVAVHPDTARHIARKLVVHFVSDRPDPDHVAHVAAAFAESGGELMPTYAALLEHPAAWAHPDTKVKPPADFVASSLRALGLGHDALRGLKPNRVRLLIAAPLAAMRQPWRTPAGPDGWPEEAEEWITPQGLAGRLQWAMTVPQVLMRELPEPLAFAEAALGRRLTPEIAFAAQNAETRWEAVGLVLASPAFQRR